MRVDWHQLINNLSDHKANLSAVSRDCGQASEWLRNFKRFKTYEPGFHAGINLLKAHVRICGRDKHREILK